MPFGSFVEGVFKGMSIRDQRKDMKRRRRHEDEQRGWNADKHEWAGDRHNWARDAHEMAMARSNAAMARGAAQRSARARPLTAGDIIGEGYSGGAAPALSSVPAQTPNSFPVAPGHMGGGHSFQPGQAAPQQPLSAAGAAFQTVRVFDFDPATGHLIPAQA